MPDKRRKGSTEYSTHRPTQQVRERLNRLTPDQLAEHKARSSEYQCLWQLCYRISAKPDYKNISVGLRKTMLLNATKALMAKRYFPLSRRRLFSSKQSENLTCFARRERGQTMCGISEEAMVNRHLKKEAQSRTKKRRNNGIDEAPLRGPGISVDLKRDDSDFGERAPVPNVPQAPLDLDAESASQGGLEEPEQPRDPPNSTRDKPPSTSLTTVVRKLQEQLSTLRDDYRTLYAHTNCQFNMINQRAERDRHLLYAWDERLNTQFNNLEDPGWNTLPGGFEDLLAGAGNLNFDQTGETGHLNYNEVYENEYVDYERQQERGHSHDSQRPELTFINSHPGQFSQEYNRDHGNELPERPNFPYNPWQGDGYSVGIMEQEPGQGEGIC